MPSGIQKATMLLTTLDPASASELLKSASPDVVKKIAREMANIRSGSGPNQEKIDRLLGEFADMVDEGSGGPADGYLKQLLSDAVGENESKEILADVRREALEKDPFHKIRKQDPALIAAALEKEPATVISAVLAELDSEKSMALLSMFDDAIRDEVVQCMAFGKRIPEETRNRIAKVIGERLKELQKSDDVVGSDSGDGLTPQMRQYRKVALMVRGLGNELRISTLEKLKANDPDAADGVSRMMVLWEDIETVPDRALAEVLRGVNSKTLALALMDADPETTRRMRNNISERAAAMLDEEADLITNAKESEINQAREEILDALRDLNAQGFVY